jgi:hypothetical protein
MKKSTHARAGKPMQKNSNQIEINQMNAKLIKAINQ